MFEIMETLIDFILELFADDVEMVTKYHEHESSDGLSTYTIDKTITVYDPEEFLLLRNKIATRIAHKLKAGCCIDFAITYNVNELLVFYSDDTSEKEVKFTLRLIPD